MLLNERTASNELREADVHPDPFTQFRLWLDDEVREGLRMPAAMIVATATRDGRPSVRTVLLNGLDGRGALLLGEERPPGSRRGARGQSLPRGVGRVLPRAGAGQPDRSLGITAERGVAQPGGSRGSGETARVALSGSRSAPAAALGRIPFDPRVVRVLAEPAQPAPRSPSIPSRGRAVAHRAAGALTSSRRPVRSRRPSGGAPAPRPRGTLTLFGDRQRRRDVETDVDHVDPVRAARTERTP